MAENFENGSLTFPDEVMTGSAGFFADCWGDILEVPREFLFIGHLACLGNVLSPYLSINSSLKTQARLYVVFVGESATDRKSTGIDICIDHFTKIVSGFKVSHGIGSAEGLAKILKNSNAAYAGPIGCMIVFDEFKSFVSKCKIQGSVLLPCVNTLFEKNVYENATKKHEISIKDARLSMLAATTIQTYERIYDSEFIDIGFPNRVFIVPATATAKHPMPKKLPISEADAIKQNLLDCLRHVGSGLELDFTDRAYAQYSSWYKNMSTSLHAKRLDTYSLRLCMLLAVNNLMPKIDAMIVKQAIALCDWQLEVRKQYDPVDADNKTAQMEAKIRRVLARSPLKSRELKQSVNYGRYGIWIFDTALKNLQRANEVEYNRKTKQFCLLENC
jgi:hypothetical protein